MIFLFIGCESSHSLDQSDIDQYEVKHTTDEKVAGDFSFRLVSEKEAYEVGEEVKLFGELQYIGDKEQVTISHADPMITFSIHEVIRDYHIGDIVRDIGIVREVKKHEPTYRHYTKQQHYLENIDEGFDLFMEEFLENDGFPPGYYVVRGKADFAYSDGSEEMKREEIELEIDFKVNND